MEQQGVGESPASAPAIDEQTPPIPTSPHLPPAGTGLPTPSDRLRAFQNSALQFLSTASNETLGACAVGLAASTYLVLGRLGLVLIGAVGGIVLHATWEGQDATAQGDGSQEKQQRRKRELGLEVTKRALDWRDRKREERGTEEDEISTSTVASDTLNTPDFADFPAETREALEEFTNAIIRDYVRWWYQPLLPKEMSFPAACRQTLTQFIVSFSTRLSRKRTADPVLDFMANSTSIMIVFLSELGSALKASQNQDPATAIQTYLQYQPDSSLANVINTTQQERKLSIVSDDILHNFLDKQSYNCPPVKAFLREVLAGLILQPTVEMCSKPEWINGWIVYLLEDGEPEVMNIIDAGVENMNGRTASSTDAPSNEQAKHQRRVSRAEEAMNQAMQEAERINAMIAEEEEQRKAESSLLDHDDTTSNTTADTGRAGITTPTSSDSEHNRKSARSSFLFDAEGNAIQSASASPVRKPVYTSLDGTHETIEAPSMDEHFETQAAPALEQNESARHAAQTFDAMGLPQAEVAEVQVPLPLTLQHAFITLIDMGDGDDRAAIKKEPKDDLYMVQIEPASSKFPGWMVTRGYTDFQKIHPTLLTLAKISGVPEFLQQYPELPSWRGVARRSFRASLEYYLRDALKYERLAESDTMKKFLDKEVGISKAPTQTKNVFVQGGAALENVGKNFVNVLGQGGKGIAGGGKAVFGGVQGAFGTIASGIAGPKKPATPQRPTQTNLRTTTGSSISLPRSSQDLPRQSIETSGTSSDRPANPIRMSSDYSQRSGPLSGHTSPMRLSQESLNLPPPPDAISDEYVPVKPMSVGTPVRQTPNHSPPSTPKSTHKPAESLSASRSLPPKPKTQQTPLTEEETRVTIDLMFAIITELYSLSSAWTIRMSLLSAAKTYLLRPQNPQLESIRALLQESVLDANFSDAGMAVHIRKLRENAAPTDEERAKWPAELTDTEKEELRVKARKLLVERGMPQALTSVMGAAASGEALGRVFDCLQVEEVARGLIFALMLQAIRATTQ